MEKHKLDLIVIKTIIRDIGPTIVAKKTGISRATLYNILNEKHELSHKHFLLIKELLND